MRIRFLSILLLVISFAFNQAYAQRHHFVSYSIKDGLAQSQVRDMTQTKDGFIWVATVGGLSRFDGFKFLNYNKSNGLLSNGVYALHEKDSVLWAACSGGLVAISGDSISQFQFDSSLHNVLIFDITSFEGDDRLFLATNGRGLLVFEDGKVTQVIKGTKDQNFIRSLCAVEDNLLLGTKDGLLRWSEQGLEPMISDISVWSIRLNSGSIWISTNDKGIWHKKVSEAEWSTINIKNGGLSSNHARDLAFDTLGNCWIIGKHQLAVYHIPSEKVNQVTPIDEDVWNNLRHVLCDKEGNIWIGTDGTGIAKFTGNAFEIYTTDDGLSSDLVMDISEHSDGSLWFATYGDGAMRLKDGTWSNFRVADNLNNNTVWCLLDRPNEVWIGTSDGISIWSDESQSIKSFPLNDQLSYPKILAMLEDENGNIWIGNRDGVSVYDGTKLTTPDAIRGTKIREVKAFLMQSSILYFASSNGLCAYDLTRKKLQLLSEQEGLPDRNVSCLTQDQLGNIWIGTGTGIAVYNKADKLIKPYKLPGGFSSNIVNFILADNMSRLWVGTDNGLFKMNLQTLYTSDSVAWTTYNEHQGVTSSEFNQNAIFQDKENGLWFGTNNGLFRFNGSQEFGLSILPPSIYISGLHLNHEPLRIDKRVNDEGIIEFDARENRLTFYYSAVHFSNPDNIMYSYRLLGSGDDWSPPTKDDHVTFSNMSGGSYQFQVKAKPLGSSWSKVISSREIYIRPPFWLTWWFIGSVLIILGLIAFQVHQIREKQRQRKKVINELENKAKILGLEQQTLNAHMNRHFIFNALNSIQYYINTQDRRSANMYLTNFAHLVRKNLDSAQVDMIYLKDELDRLKLYLKLEHMRFADRFVYEFDVDRSIDQEMVKVPSMILQPFVENSIMHGILPLERKGNLYLGIKRVEEGLEFTIRDNGIGISESLKQKEGTSKHVSNGMKITRQRMELLKKMTGKNYSVIGPFELKDSLSQAIKGTEVRIVLPEAAVIITPIVMN